MYDINLISKWKTVLMGFAALWIYFNHEWITLFDHIPFLGKSEEFMIEIGFCGVDIFLLLSGMGLTYSIKKSGLLSFYWRRIRRVMIPFVLTGAFIAYIDKWGLNVFLKNVSGYSFYAENMYTFLWFVPAIMTFYFFFPFYYYFFQKSENKLFFTASILELWLILSIFINGTLRGELYGLTNRIPVFLLGILLGWLCQNKKILLHRQAYLFFVITLLLGTYLSYLTNYQKFKLLVPTPNCCVPNLLISVSLVFLLSGMLEALSSMQKLAPLTKAITGFFAFFGKISLEFYCLQEWIADKAEVTQLTQLSDKMYNLILFFIAVAGGFLLYLISKGIMTVLDHMLNSIVVLFSKV